MLLFLKHETIVALILNARLPKFYIYISVERINVNCYLRISYQVKETYQIKDITFNFSKSIISYMFVPLFRINSRYKKQRVQHRVSIIIKTCSLFVCLQYLDL